MKNKQPAPPPRVRLYSHVTKTRFLHVEDALNIGKVRLFAGVYNRGQGMSSHTSHYLDIPDARIVFRALLNGEQDFSYKEYKGTPPRSPRQAAVSRVLSLAIKGDNVYIELKSGPGQLTLTGAITPNGRADTEVNVPFKLPEARRLAAEVLAYLHAWDVYRMMAFYQAVGQPSAYPLSPPAGELVQSPPAPAVTHDDVAGPGNAHRLPTATPDLTRPVTRNGLLPKANGVGATAADRPTISAAKLPEAAARLATIAEAIYGSEEVLLYGDGLAVDADNATEVMTFRRYVAAMEESPATKAVLQAYYRQQMTT